MNEEFKSILAMSNRAQLDNMVKYINAPSGFSWQNNPLVNKIWKDRREEFYTSYDVSEKQSTGKTYYVSATSGNDSNNGLTLTTALKTILAAYNKSDVEVIILCDQRIYYSNALNGTVITKSITIKGFAGSRPILTTHNSTSWSKTAGYTSVYEATKSNVGAVVDVLNSDSNGDKVGLTLLASIALCDSMENSYYADGTKVYVHIVGGGSPGLGIQVIRSDIEALTAVIPSESILYLENLDIIGGFVNTGAGQIYAKSCTFQYGKLDDSFRNESGYSVLQNCVASHATNDGFSYSSAHSVEIDCAGRYNGDGIDGIDNGSTAHTGSKIIRVNGEYYRNYGPNVADVQDNTESWNLGCEAHDSNGTTWKYDFSTSDGASKMFLDGCKAYNTLVNVFVKNTANIYTHNCNFNSYGIGTTDTTGTISSY